MFKSIEIIFSLKHVKGFVPYDWINVGQCHLACISFAEGAF